MPSSGHITPIYVYSINQPLGIVTRVLSLGLAILQMT